MPRINKKDEKCHLEEWEKEGGKKGHEGEEDKQVRKSVFSYLEAQSPVQNIHINNASI